MQEQGPVLRMREKTQIERGIRFLGLSDPSTPPERRLASTEDCILLYLKYILFFLMYFCYLLLLLLINEAAFLVAYKPKKGRKFCYILSFHYISIFLVIA